MANTLCIKKNLAQVQSSLAWPDGFLITTTHRKHFLHGFSVHDHLLIRKQSDHTRLKSSVYVAEWSLSHGLVRVMIILWYIAVSPEFSYCIINT